MTIIRTIDGKPVNYSPGIFAESEGGGQLGVDPSGATLTRGAVLTDEGGYRCNFSGTSLYNTIGTCVFTNGSTAVTGTGFATNREIHVGEYIKLVADAETYLARVVRIIDDSNIELESNYLGAGGTGAAHVGKMLVKIGTGCSYTVGNGVLAAVSGTTSGSVFELEREVDYIPITKQSALSISQRNLNQTIYAGLYDDFHVTPRYWCWFKFSGTNNLAVTCESAYNRNDTPTSYDIETSQIVLAAGLSTNQSLRYRIEASPDKVRFLINGVSVAEHYKSIPNPYEILTSTIRIVNDSTVGNSTTVNVDYDVVQNYNKVTSSPPNDSEPAGANTSDMETLVDLMAQLVGKTGLPDPLGRVRVYFDSLALGNLTYINGTTVLQNTGVGGLGAPRMSLVSESPTVIGATLPIIYNNISITA